MDQRHGDSQDRPSSILSSFSSEDLMLELQRRGGTLKACADAQLLVLKKSADYNQTGGTAVAHTFDAKRDDYFPFGLVSYAQMIHTKSQRLISLAIKEGMHGQGSNFESARDTLLDLINYGSFGADWLERRQGGTVVAIDRAERGTAERRQ